MSRLLSSVGDSRAAGDVHIVLDNTGSELALDLLLVDALLSFGFARVTLHVKMHPTFVSDATAADVHTLFAALRRQGERTRLWPRGSENALRKGACGFGLISFGTGPRRSPSSVPPARSAR